MTGVASHVSMSEKSRMETLEKTVAQHQRWLGELAKIVQAQDERIEELEDELEHADEDLRAISTGLDAYFKLSSPQPELAAAGAESQEELPS